MAVIYADTDDGRIVKSSGTYAGARDSTSGLRNDSETQSSSAIQASRIGRLSYTYSITRSFFFFDVRTIGSPPSSGEFKVRGYSNNSLPDVILVKSSHGTSLDNTDFDAIVGWQTGVDNIGNVTHYSTTAGTTSWNTAGWNTFTLSTEALSDIYNDSAFTCCLLARGNDLRNVAPTSTKQSGLVYADTLSATNKPHLDITEYSVGINDGANNALSLGTIF